MANKSNHVPRFGDWDSNDNTPYTAVFDQARIGKGGKVVNPNDPAEGYPDNKTNEGLYSGTTTKPSNHHRRKNSRDDGELGIGNQGGNSRHARRASRGEEGFASYHENKNSERISLEKGGSGVSPIHPQSYQGRGGRLGSASPAADRSGAPGTPNRNRPERYAAQLPKFGDWDVNNPGAGDGFTVIFDKARDEKKTGGAVRVQDSPFRTEAVEIQKSQPTHESSKWFCSCFQPSTVT